MNEKEIERERTRKREKERGKAGENVDVYIDPLNGNAGIGRGPILDTLGN